MTCPLLGKKYIGAYERQGALRSYSRSFPLQALLSAIRNPLPEFLAFFCHRLSCDGGQQ